MSVKTISDKRDLQAFSTDAPIPIDTDGSTLHFVDTGATFVAHDGMWIVDQRMSWQLNLLLKITQ
jgi:hypothetical protein